MKLNIGTGYNDNTPPTGLGLQHVVEGAIMFDSMESNTNCGIYKITSPSGKIYVGQSTNLRKRKNVYKHLRCVDQRLLYNSLLKYGWDSHIFEVIHLCSPEELNKWEKYYGDFFKCRDPKLGLNLREYGNHGKHSEETCKKIGAIHKGKKLSEAHKAAVSKAQKGRIVSEETKQKLKASSTRLSADISKRNSGEGNHMWGKQHSEETRTKIGAKSKGRSPSPQVRALRSARMRGKKLSQKQIERLASSKRKVILNTQTGIYYDGVIEAAKSIGALFTTLYSRLNGHLKNNTSLIYV